MFGCNVKKCKMVELFWKTLYDFVCKQRQTLMPQTPNQTYQRLYKIIWQKAPKNKAPVDINMQISPRIKEKNINSPSSAFWATEQTFCWKEQEFSVLQELRICVSLNEMQAGGMIVNIKKAVCVCFSGHSNCVCRGVCVCVWERERNKKELR